jgi:endonuclease G
MSATSTISATSVYGPMRIELYDQHATRLARGFGHLHQAVPPGIYSLQYGSGAEFREELIRVEPGQVVERHLEMMIPTAAPISTSVTSHEFHRDAARDLSLNPRPYVQGGGAGLMVFARALEGFGRGPVSMRGLSLLDSSLTSICSLGSDEFHHQADGWAGVCLEVRPGGYALQWARVSKAAPSSRVLQSLWASQGWTTIVFLGYGAASGGERAGQAAEDPHARAGLTRQAASIHMVRMVDGFQRGPDASHVRSQPLDWETNEAKVGQALELALLGLRTGSSVVPDNLLDLLLHAKFQNPMLGVVGAHALLQRRKKDWSLFNTVLGNLERLIGSDQPDVSALAAMGLNQGNPQSPVRPKSLRWPPMLCTGYRAVLERDWLEKGGLVELASAADSAAAGLLPEFPWTCWSEGRPESSLLASAGEAIHITVDVPFDEIAPGVPLDLTAAPGIAVEGISAGGLSVPRRAVRPRLAATAAPDTRLAFELPPSLGAARSGAVIDRMVQHVRTLQLLDPTLRFSDLKPAHFRQLGLPKSTIEDAISALRAVPDTTTAPAVQKPKGEPEMASNKDLEVECVAMTRIAKSEAQIKESLKNIAAGNPLGAEKDNARLVRRLMTKNQLSKEEAGAVARGIRATSALARDDLSPLSSVELQDLGAEAIWGTIDFVGVSFLEKGLRAARSVARIAFSTGRAQGTGFMVSDGLLMTNNHVIASPEEARYMVAEFDYELDLQDNARSMTKFALDPDSFFVTHPVQGLDFTLVAIGTRLSGSKEIAEFGWCPLSAANDKHAIGEAVNIVQHPRGRYKEVVLRENRLVARADEALHYVADTEPGASGSPVYNNQWQPIALHHWGGPFRAVIDDQGQKIPAEINEGIRISAIVKTLAAMLPQLTGPHVERLRQTLAQWESIEPGGEYETPARDAAAAPRAAQSSSAPRVNVDGTVTLTLPLEITIGLAGSRHSAPSVPNAVAAPAVATKLIGLAGAGEATKPSPEYDERIGYEAGFIPGHVVPLPRLTGPAANDAARVLDAQPGADPHELKYHHFSAVVNKRRRLAFFVACNIDGKTSKFINRDTGEVRALDPSNPDHGLMERLNLTGAEASEQWYDDPRLAEGSAANQSIYSSQVVQGFPSGMGRTLRMFQRGHLVRRLDPAWGTKNQALLAEADTFHFTNCAPQVGFFNMGRANPSITGTGGGRLWRAVENLVLRNARNMRSRVTCFTGPIFTSSDRVYRTIKIPQRFFKIAVWADDDGLRSLAMIADQSKVLSVWPEALFEAGGEAIEGLGSEAFQGADELERVDDFLTTVAEVESVTGLDFSEAVRAADIRAGSESLRPRDLDAVARIVEYGAASENAGL